MYVTNARLAQRIVLSLLFLLFLNCGGHESLVNVDVSSSSLPLSSNTLSSSAISSTANKSSSVLTSSSSVVSSSSNLSSSSLFLSSSTILVSSSSVPLSSSSFILSDSAFDYGNPVNDYNRGPSYRLLELLKVRNEVKTLIIGSSRFRNGIYPYYLDKWGLRFNYTAPGLDSWTIVELMKNYVMNHAVALENLVIEFSLDFFLRDHSTADKLFLKTNGGAYDASLQYWPEGIPISLDTLIQSRLDSHSYKASAPVDGYTATNGHGFGVPPLDYKPTSTLDSNCWKQLVQELTDQIRIACNLGIKVVAVTTPQNPLYRDLGAYGKYGTSLSQASEILDSIYRQTEGVSGFVLLDEHQMGNHSYTASMAYDFDHLSTVGAKYLTTKVQNALDSLRQ